MPDLKKPNDALLFELENVASQASALRTLIQQHNYLPADFPGEQLDSLISSLEGLPNGSVQGCRIPLEHSIVRLSELRRAFFIFVEEDREDAGEKETDASPTLQRGDFLDRQLSEIISSASTALDAFREQSRSEFESSSTEEFNEILPQISGNKDLRARGGRFAGELGEFAATAHQSGEAGDERVQSAALSASDAKNAILSTNAEISSRFLIRGWLRKLMNSTAGFLKALRLSIQGIKGGVGLWRSSIEST